MMYDWETGPYIIDIAKDVVPLSRQAARQAYGRVGFWPFDLDFREAVNWWEERDMNPDQNEGLPSKEPCPQCGPGYYIGDDGCRHSGRRTNQ
jgi:hypothetical protein